MKLLIVGGFGFLGKHLLEKAKNLDAGITVIARKDPDIKWASYPYVLENSLDPNALEQLACDHDAVVYMASSSIPATGSFTKELTENVEPAVNLIENLTRFNKNLRVVYLSSGGQIYGNDYSRLITENDICKPRSPYGYGKLITESSLEYLHRLRGTSIVVLRVSNPVGMWQTGLRQGIVNVVYQSIIHSETLKIFGDGSEARDYIDADELSEVIIAFCKRRFKFDIFNVGSGLATSTLDLIEKVEELVGGIARKEFLSRRPVDPKFAVLNCSKLHSELGIKLSTKIEEILKKTIEKKANIRQ